MENNFNFEIVSPEKIIFSDKPNMVTIPSYEGDMSVLKNHIPIIAFLRPGIINVKKNNEDEISFFVEDGIMEFSNDNLSILSTKVINTKDLSKENLENYKKDGLSKLALSNLNDEERYILNHKINTIENIS